MAYKFGISGPWWYGAGATVQVLLFAMVSALMFGTCFILSFSVKLAAKLKLNAPYVHTWLEIIGVRWGKVAHLVFMFFAYAPDSSNDLAISHLSWFPVSRLTSLSAQC